MASSTRWILSLTFGLIGAATLADSHAADSKGELRALREQLDALKREMAESEGDRKEVADQLRDSERAISEATKSYREHQAAQRKAREEHREIDARIRQNELDIASRSKNLERIVYFRYVHGEVGPLRVMLASRDFSSLARDLYYLSHVSRAQSDMIRGLRESLAELNQLAHQSRAKAEELAALEAAARDGRSKLEAERAEWRSVLARLSSQIQKQRRSMQTLQANERRMAELVERLSRAIRERPVPSPSLSKPTDRNDKVPEVGDTRGVFSSLRGKLRLPVRGEVTGRFGSPRAEGGPSWKGVFIRGSEGDEVRAVASGRIVFADWMRGFGNLLIVDHGDTYLTIYGNNESLLRRPGETVKGGDTIATLGRTGGNESAGLYFELRHQGRAIDPLSWVSLR
ncbi:MAG: peptidase M23 [Betaproteobacteria bacterium]|nr:peptidase M23 [Betaproteobacteria bacterium]